MEKIMNQSQLNQVKERELESIKNSKCRILICAGTGCLAGGSGQIYEKMCELVKDNPDVEVHFGPSICNCSNCTPNWI